MANPTTLIIVDVGTKAAWDANKCKVIEFTYASTSPLVKANGDIDLSGTTSDVLIMFRLDVTPLQWTGETVVYKRIFLDAGHGARDACWVNEKENTAKPNQAASAYPLNFIEFTNFTLYADRTTVSFAGRNKAKTPYYYSLNLSVPGCKPDVFRADPCIRNGGNGLSAPVWLPVSIEVAVLRIMRFIAILLGLAR